MSNHFTIIGRLGGDPELRFTAQGAAVCSGSIADTPRRKNAQTGQWEDAGETLWIRFSIWNAAAEALAEAARKGDQVTAVGRLRQRSYERDGQKHVAVELDAREPPILMHAHAQLAEPQPQQELLRAVHTRKPLARELLPVGEARR